MMLYIYKKADDSASRSQEEIKLEQYTTSNTPATNATIGGLIGAAIGGLGGYMWGASDLDHLSEEEKFRRKLKNALLYGAVGAVGGAGLGYGGTTLVDQMDKKREKNFTETVINSYTKAPFGVGIGGGALLGGAGYGISGAIVPSHALKGTTRGAHSFRRGVHGAMKGALVGGVLDLAKGITQTIVND